MDENLASLLPLSPPALHILLSLAAEPRHGYGIMQDVRRQSDDGYRLGPGTLYDNLRKLMDSALVAEAPPPKHNDDPRRRYYQLTGLGRAVLAAEVERLRRVIHEAGARLKPNPARGRS